MRRIFLASGAMSIKIPDKIETILINIHQRLRANPPHASPRLARLRRGGQGPRGEGLQYWHWYCDEYTIHATHTETVPTSERLRLTNLWISCGDNLFQYLLSSGSFQQLPNAFSDDCEYITVWLSELKNWRNTRWGWLVLGQPGLMAHWMWNMGWRIGGLGDKVWRLGTSPHSHSAHPQPMSVRYLQKPFFPFPVQCWGMHDSPSCGLGIKILFYPRNCQFGDGWI